MYIKNPSSTEQQIEISSPQAATSIPKVAPQKESPLTVLTAARSPFPRVASSRSLAENPYPPVVYLRPENTNDTVKGALLEALIEHVVSEVLVDALFYLLHVAPAS